MIDSVIDLVEEHVDLGGSQFSESTVERWFFARVSQRNLVVLEFWSPCLPLFFHEVSHRQCWVFQPHDIFEGRFFTATVSVKGRPILNWVCSTLGLLLSSDERAWISSVSTGRSVLSEETEFFAKRIHTNLLRTRRFSFILHFITPDLSRIGFGVGWVDWKNLVSNNFSFWSSNSFSLLFFRTQFSCPFVLLRDLWRKSRWVSSLGSIGRK